LHALLGFSAGWVNHPATKMWRGHEFRLAEYSKAIADECFIRGFKSHYDYFYGLQAQFDDCVLPKWFSNEEVFSSYRSKLLFKGRVDAVCLGLKRYLRTNSINAWLKANDRPEKNLLTRKDVENLEYFALYNSIEIGQNHYSQFGWSESDDKNYIWPV
jgi:hypothetical protein